MDYYDYDYQGDIQEQEQEYIQETDQQFQDNHEDDQYYQENHIQNQQFQQDDYEDYNQDQHYNHEQQQQEQQQGYEEQIQQDQQINEFTLYEELIEQGFQLLSRGDISNGLETIEMALYKMQDYGDNDLFNQNYYDVMIALSKEGVKQLNKGNIQDAYAMFEKFDYFTQPDQFINGDKDSLRILGLNNFGCFYRRNKEIDQALDCLNEAYELLQKIDNSRFQGLTYLNLSAIYSQLKNHQKCLDFSIKSVENLQEDLQIYCEGKLLNELQGDPEFIEIVSNLSMAYYNQGLSEEHFHQYEECSQSYENALKVSGINLGQDSRLAVKLKKLYDEFQKRYNALQRSQQRQQQREYRENLKRSLSQSKRDQARQFSENARGIRSNSRQSQRGSNTSFSTNQNNISNSNNQSMQRKLSEMSEKPKLIPRPQSGGVRGQQHSTPSLINQHKQNLIDKYLPPSHPSSQKNINAKNNRIPPSKQQYKQVYQKQLKKPGSKSGSRSGSKKGSYTQLENINQNNQNNGSFRNIQYQQGDGYREGLQPYQKKFEAPIQLQNFNNFHDDSNIMEDEYQYLQQQLQIEQQIKRPSSANPKMKEFHDSQNQKYQQQQEKVKNIQEKYMKRPPQQNNNFMQQQQKQKQRQNFNSHLRNSNLPQNDSVNQSEMEDALNYNRKKNQKPYQNKQQQQQNQLLQQQGDQQFELANLSWSEGGGEDDINNLEIQSNKNQFLQNIGQFQKQQSQEPGCYEDQNEIISYQQNQQEINDNILSIVDDVLTIDKEGSFNILYNKQEMQVQVNVGYMGVQQSFYMGLDLDILKFINFKRYFVDKEVRDCFSQILVQFVQSILGKVDVYDNQLILHKIFQGIKIKNMNQESLITNIKLIQDDYYEVIVLQ